MRYFHWAFQSGGQYRLYALTPTDPKSQPCEKPETQGKTIQAHEHHAIDGKHIARIAFTG
jgi:hypothetical protein